MDLPAALSEWRAIFTAVFPPPLSEAPEPQWALDLDKYGEPEVDSFLMQVDYFARPLCFAACLREICSL